MQQQTTIQSTPDQVLSFHPYLRLPFCGGGGGPEPSVPRHRLAQLHAQPLQVFRGTAAAGIEEEGLVARVTDTHSLRVPERREAR